MAACRSVRVTSARRALFARGPSRAVILVRGNLPRRAADQRTDSRWAITNVLRGLRERAGAFTRVRRQFSA